MNIPIYEMKLSELKKPYLVEQKTMRLGEKIRVCSPQDVLRIVNSMFDLENKAEEIIIILGCLAGTFYSAFQVTQGTHNMAYASPRSIYARLLLSGCTEYIMVHNHPSGNLIPSKDDIQVYKRMKECSDILEISILDFMIVSDCGYLSFKEKGMS